jgi:hypothetical protein
MPVMEIIKPQIIEAFSPSPSSFFPSHKGRGELEVELFLL